MSCDLRGVAGKVNHERVALAGEKDADLVRHRVIGQGHRAGVSRQALGQAAQVHAVGGKEGVNYRLDGRGLAVAGRTSAGVGGEARELPGNVSVARLQDGADGLAFGREQAGVKGGAGSVVRHGKAALQALAMECHGEEVLEDVQVSAWVILNIK